MANISKELMKQANIIPRLELAVKNEKGAVVGTGVHKVKFLEDKMGKKTLNGGETVPCVVYIFEEAGEKKEYRVEIKTKEGNLHYLVQRMSKVLEGEEIEMEYKRSGMKGYIDVRQKNEAKEELPIINQNYGENIPEVDDTGEEIPDISF